MRPIQVKPLGYEPTPTPSLPAHVAVAAALAIGILTFIAAAALLGKR